MVKAPSTVGTFAGITGRQLRAVRGWIGVGTRGFSDFVAPFNKDHISQFENDLLNDEQKASFLELVEVVATEMGFDMDDDGNLLLPG